MPSSASNGKQAIKKYIKEKSYKKILDIGCGRGTYALLFKDEEDFTFVGVDVIDYRKRFPWLENIYTSYNICDMREVEKIKELGYFDLIILGDVLEHISVEDAQKVIENYKKQCKCLLVAVPYLYPQHFPNNHYEDHIQDDLTNDIFLERYPGFKLFKQYSRNGKPFYGYYILENQE